MIDKSKPRARRYAGGFWVLTWNDGRRCVTSMSLEGVWVNYEQMRFS